MWFIFHRKFVLVFWFYFGFTTYCDLLVVKQVHWFWYWFGFIMPGAMIHQTRHKMLWFGVWYWLFLGGLLLVLSKKSTFCNRACVQIALKPLGLGLVLWFYDVVWCFVIYSIPENIIKSYLILNSLSNSNYNNSWNTKIHSNV